MRHVVLRRLIDLVARNRTPIGGHQNSARRRSRVGTAIAHYPPVPTRRASNESRHFREAADRGNETGAFPRQAD